MTVLIHTQTRRSYLYAWGLWTSLCQTILMSKNAWLISYIWNEQMPSWFQERFWNLFDPSISLDPSNIRGQAYDGASLMSSGKEGVQAKIKEISLLALFTHCFAYCLNLSIAASCKLSEVRNLIGLINEAYLFLITAQSDSSCLSWLWKNACLRIPTVSFQVYARHAGWKDTRA